MRPLPFLRKSDHDRDSYSGALGDAAALATLSPGDGITRIVQSTGSGGVRTILTGLKNHETRSLATINGDGTIHTEAGVEPIVAKHLDMNTRVLRFRSQPYRLEGSQGGASFSMVNDFAILWRSGHVEVVEVKAVPRQLRDPAYRARLLLAQAAYAAFGIGFRVAFRAEFDDETVRDNVDIAFMNRFTPVLERHRTAAVDLLRTGGGRTTLGLLSRVLEADPVRARAVAYAMTARRHLAIDLATPFDDASVVTALPPLPHHVPTLRLN